MDKRGPAEYLRLPPKLERLVEMWMRETGRLNKNDAKIYLIARGLHAEQFRLLPYLSEDINVKSS